MRKEQLVPGKTNGRIILPLLILFLVTGSCVAETLSVVPTFNCLGIWWATANGADDNTCTVAYRKAGASAWQNGLDLWYDGRPENNTYYNTTDLYFKTIYAGKVNSYRGSLVNLAAGTQYEVELTLKKTGDKKTFTAVTWPETPYWPIAKTVYVAENRSDSLIISESGSPAGYILYCPQPGTSATIDVNNLKNTCITVKANVGYIILRGLVLKGAQQHGITIWQGTHDILIDSCDISMWGQKNPSATFAAHNIGADFQGAIATISADALAGVMRLVVQRCRIHDPRYDTNAWDNTGIPEINGHPQGPYGICLNFSRGNNVIRWNEIWGDSLHYYNDGIGGNPNQSMTGAPGPETDIYGNYIANIRDDAMECDGGNRNVRVWGNFAEYTYTMVSSQGTSIGPFYVFRNVEGATRSTTVRTDTAHEGIGRFIKFSALRLADSGRVYLFHNTILQPPPVAKAAYTSQSVRMHAFPFAATLTRPLGANQPVANQRVVNVIAKNNIFQARKVPGETEYYSCGYGANFVMSDIYVDFNVNRNGIFDYDLFNARAKYGNPGSNCYAWPADTTFEPHGQFGFPLYKCDPRQSGYPYGNFELSSSSLGFGKGCSVPNFNDSSASLKPDIGAHQSGAPAMRFGLEAWADYAAGINGKYVSIPARKPSKEMLAVTVMPNRTMCFRLFLEQAGAVNIHVYDVAGKTVWSSGIKNAPAGVCRIVMKTSPKSGVYFISTRANGLQQMQRLIFFP